MGAAQCTQSVPTPSIDDVHEKGAIQRQPISNLFQELSLSTRYVHGSCCESSSDDHVVLLAWELTPAAQATIDKAEILRLHEHVINCCEILGCVAYVSEATQGLIRGKPLVSAETMLSAADTAVRLGQLICRWGASKKIAIRASVAYGTLRCVALSGSSQPSYYGGAYAECKELLATSRHDLMVHLSCKVKEHLVVFKLLPLMISNFLDAYYLDPATTVQTYDTIGESSDILENDQAQSSPSQRLAESFVQASKDNVAVRWGKEDGQISIVEFERMLQAFNVDTSKFGVGVAKTLNEFYDAVIKEQKSYLTLKEGMLERVVHLVRVSLRIRDDAHKLRELRIASEQTTSGALRERNQLLAVVLRVPELGRWKEAIEKCFENKLHIPLRAQKACLEVDMESYSLDEERSTSATIPGIVTNYKAHNIIVNVKDKTSKDLRVVGLPAGTDFSFDSDASKEHWRWAHVEDRREDELMNLLFSHGIDMSGFASSAFAELMDEVYSQKCALEEENGDLVRRISIVKVWLHAAILNVDHVLVVRAKWQKGHFDPAYVDQPIVMRTNVNQDWKGAVEDALLLRVGLAREFQDAHITLESASHKMTEETAYSRSYPGLKTVYTVNEVCAHVVNIDSSAHVIGLPAGTSFSFARREALKGPQTEQVVITHWCWKMQSDIDYVKMKLIRGSSQRASITDGPVLREKSLEASPSDGKRLYRVSVPEALVYKHKGTASMPPQGDVLRSVTQDLRTNWRRAERAAKRLRDPLYSCKDFYEDVSAAFPELRLYCVSLEAENEEKDKGTISGRTSDDEYQRTIGALFALFWLMRLDMGGKESFCFGLDDEWKPRSPDCGIYENAALQKRKTFYEKMRWERFTALLLDAKLLKMDTSRNLVPDEERVLTVLVLLAIHDVMKLQLLLPVVDPEVLDFHGYKRGETISDHDIALSYVLTYSQTLLPSYAGLSKTQRSSISFVHCKMDYNMGWLVQGEAPPGALFRCFKQIIKAGQAPACDVALYFAYWFCDVAAAEPYPLQGCNKFVTKFPLSVLTMFLESFYIVQQLGTNRTETEVLNDYLAWRWKHDGVMCPIPEGKGSIARMRLVLMAQGDGRAVVDAFDELPDKDQRTLAEELAITGIQGQTYAKDSVPSQGPALLVYYAPALMQKNGSSLMKAMKILAEVLRCSRQLFPLSAGRADDSVIIRIDALKDLDVNAILKPEVGYTWVLSKMSSKDAVVQSMTVERLQTLDFRCNRVLNFARKQIMVSTLLTVPMRHVRRFSLW